MDLNSPATQSLTLSSTGTAAVTVSAATVAGTGFTVSGATFPLTLNPNQTATLSIEFDPTAAGAVSGSLTLTSNSSTGSSTVITLTGTGEATSYEVNLTWDAPTTSTDPVAGYNVYRSPSGGTSYQELNTSAITQTSYVDTTVPGWADLRLHRGERRRLRCHKRSLQHGKRNDTIGAKFEILRCSLIRSVTKCA